MVILIVFGKDSYSYANFESESVVIPVIGTGQKQRLKNRVVIWI